MKSIFGRHRIRSNFYHFVSCLYVLVMIFWGVGLIPDMASTIIGFVLFAVDYIAHMYDPHPENPGPWFRSHFHRFIDGDDDEGVAVEDDGTSSRIFLGLLLAVTMSCSVAYVASSYFDDITAGEVATARK